MNNGPIPNWVRWLALLVLLGQAGAFALMLSGRLHGPQRNLVPQALIGGAMALLVLAAYVVRYHPASMRPAPVRVGIIALTVLALGLCGLYFVRNRAILTLPYDLGGWSESFFMTDIIKWRTGTPLYTAPEDSNSGAYTPGAPALSFFLAKVLGRSDSITTYRWLLQLYLMLASVFTGATAWNLLRIADPDRFPHISRLWLPFFILTGFLVATNAETGAFNIFLHNDPLSVLVSALAFWVLTQFAWRRNPRWLAVMAVMPALGFWVKQYLAIFVAVYVVYLWLDGKWSWRQILAFAAISISILGASVAAGFLVWGGAFRYWVFEIMGGHTVSFFKLNERFADAAWNILLGLFGGLVLLRGERLPRFLGLWTAWLVMTLAALYTSGITFLPTHLGSAAMVGASLALAALVSLWPATDEPGAAPAQQWVQGVAGFLVVLAVFAGMGFTRVSRVRISAVELNRYVGDVEREFHALPADRVLLDMGEWIYLRQNSLPKDRMAIFNTHRVSHYGLIDRIHRREYAKILVHVLADGRLSYDLGVGRGIEKELRAYYHQTRRIPGVRGTSGWLFYEMAMSDLVVFEPGPEMPQAPAAAAPGGKQ